MAISPNPADVRFISIDGGKLHLVLDAGQVELSFNNREELSNALRKVSLRSAPQANPHVMFDDGILEL